MSMGSILLIIFVLMLIGVIPIWPYSRNWGYMPSGGIGLLVILLFLLVIMGRF